MRETIREKIYESIRDQITYGKLNPGERLTEHKLANDFKASRSPIREALRQLESEGLITSERNKGITVSKLSIKQVEEIYSIRLLLESHAAGLTAQQATKAQVAHLKYLLETCKKAAKNYDIPGWIYNNDLFHNFFYEHCGNGNLNIILQGLKRRIYRYQYLVLRNPKHFKTFIEYHEAIFRACKRNDTKMTEKYMKLHLQNNKDLYINCLNEINGLYEDTGRLSIQDTSKKIPPKLRSSRLLGESATLSDSIQ